MLYEYGSKTPMTRETGPATAVKLCMFAIILIATSILILNTEVSDASIEGIIIEGDLTDTARFYITDEYNLFKTFVKSIR